MTVEPITFALQPFEKTAETTDLAIAATVTRNHDLLSISYCLTGDLSQVVIPSASKSPYRKDRLWEQTCFEFFLAVGHEQNRSTSYWEFNLSPTGDWNVFALQGYRQGLSEEAAFSAMPFTRRTLAEALHLDLSVNIGSLIESAQPWRLGISTVLLLRSQRESFWAIAHPAPEADFHHPDGFIIQLNP
jgi:hypothetical protein